MTRNPLTGVAILALVAATATIAFVLLVPPPIDGCFDRGGWWSRTALKCECTDAELADPATTKERKDYCDAERRSPKSE
jgi:hypothetical protein